MPRARRPDYDSPEFAQRWQSDETLESLAEWLGVSATAVFRAAKRRRLARKRMEKIEGRSKRKSGDHPPELVRAYVAVHYLLSRGL